LRHNTTHPNNQHAIRLIAALGLTIIGAVMNRWLNIEMAFGISFLAGNAFGILACLLAPWPYGIFGAVITMLPTLVLWAHPYALASVMLEGLMLAILTRRGKIDRIILYESIYWPLIGAPLVFFQYTVFLRMNTAGALAAATKQGVNALSSAITGIMLYYLLRSILKFKFTAHRLPGAREYFALILNISVILPTLIGITLYTADRKQRTILNAERETALVLTMIQSYNPMADRQDAVFAALKELGHEASFQDPRGTVKWTTNAAMDFRYANGRVLHGFQSNSTAASIVSDATEANPMKRWAIAIVRAEQQFTDGSRLIVANPLGPEVAGLNNSLTLIFLALLIWWAMALTIAFLAATLLVRPLEHIRKVAEQVQKGELAVHWPDSMIMEIQDLRDSLVAMTGSLEQRGIELSEARQAAETMMQRAERYLAFMGHELKAPLSALSVALSTDLVGRNRIDPGSFKESIQRLLELIDDILDQAKASAGRLVLRSESFDPGREATILLEPFAIQARRKGLSFDLRIDRKVQMLIWGDVLRYRQILANLVGNAIKYTQQGWVTILLDGSMDTGLLKLRGLVEDSGMGIEEERLPSIWKPFASSQPRSSDGQSSHGLGLSIVKSIIDAMDGTIAVTSQPGKGSRFSFELPFQLSGRDKPAGQEPETDNINEQGNPDLRGLRVLIADDERLSRMALGHFLRNWGATVDTAENGQEALDAYRSTAYNLVLLDQHMPLMRGQEALVAMRQIDTDSSRKPAIAIISSAEPADRGYTGRPDAILSKPVEPAKLAQLLRSFFPDST
jgi:signal transduction histidine kinase